MAKTFIVVHYHELWLKGGNRRFFLGKLITGLKRALEGAGLEKMHCPGDRILLQFREGASVGEAVERIKRVSGVANFAVAQQIGRADAELDFVNVLRTAWDEVAPQRFATFAVRAKRSDKSFPMRTAEIEPLVGGYLFDRLREEGRDVSVDLDAPELTCRIEVTKTSVLVFARRIAGPGGLPPNTGGRLVCLLSGGFDSAVAAYKMMRRGAHVTFVHFWGGGGQAGESSAHVARELAQKLTAWQFTSKLYLVPFEPLQREIVQRAPETFRVLLYRRLMLRIAQQFAFREQALGIISGDSLGQVASQTLHNMAAVGSVARLPIYRPLAGDDKLEIMALARQIGTHDISAEPFHDCCPVFMPRSPALFATVEDLDAAEATLDIPSMVTRGLETATLERYKLTNGRVESFVSMRKSVA
jgi:tRNA uracil 4-sulfurtransferase